MPTSSLYMKDNLQAVLNITVLEMSQNIILFHNLVIYCMFVVGISKIEYIIVFFSEKSNGLQKKR